MATCFSSPLTSGVLLLIYYLKEVYFPKLLGSSQGLLIYLKYCDLEATSEVYELREPQGFVFYDGTQLQEMCAWQAMLCTLRVPESAYTRCQHHAFFQDLPYAVPSANLITVQTLDSFVTCYLSHKFRGIP